MVIKDSIFVAEDSKSKKAEHSERDQKPILGWREWVELLDFGSAKIKAKIDTGAKTSAIHAEDIVVFKRKGRRRVRFRLYPLQRSREGAVWVEADLLEKRKVRSSVGHETQRPVVLAQVGFGDRQLSIELSLINRDIMGFRMLIGRQAIRNLFLVDPGRSFLIGKKKKQRRKKKTSVKSIGVSR
jgi:hypothetical protein